MHQAAHLLPGGGQSLTGSGPNQHIEGFSGGQVMADGANPAQPLNQHGGFPIRPALDETFKAPELDNVKPGSSNLILIIQVNGHLSVTLNSGDRFYGNFL
jgi:hypothetical protein